MPFGGDEESDGSFSRGRNAGRGILAGIMLKFPFIPGFYLLWGHTQLRGSLLVLLRGPIGMPGIEFRPAMPKAFPAVLTLWVVKFF